MNEATAVLIAASVIVLGMGWWPCCCGPDIGDACASCDANTTLSQYTVTVAGITTTTPPAGDVCDDCGVCNGSFVLTQDASVPCFFSYALDDEVCAEMGAGDFPLRLTRVTLFFGYDGSGPPPASGFTRAMGSLQFSRFTGINTGRVLFYLDIDNGGGDSKINCMTDVDGAVMPYQDCSSGFGVINVCPQCAWSGGTMTIST